jgi:phosphoserine phosphatase RsbU/P
VENTESKTVRFEERAELLDFLLEVSELTASSLDLDQVLDSVADVIHRVVGFDVFAILLYSERRKTLRVRHAIGHREELVRNLSIEIGEGIVGTAAQLRRPVSVGNVRLDNRYLNALDAIRSELAVPMFCRGRLVGVIDLESTRLNAYGKREEALLTLIANRVASSVDNARLYRRVEMNNRTLKVLSNLTKEFSAILDLDSLLEKLASSVRTLIHFDGFSILLVNHEEATLKHRFSLRFDQRRSVDIPLSKGITGAAVRERQPIRVADTGTDPRYIETFSGIRSEVAVPLIVHDVVIGVMDLESEKVNFFNEEHVRTLSLLAPQIASAVENARLYEEIASRQARMEADLSAARRVQSLLLPTKAPAIAGLEIGMGMRPAREVTGDIYDIFDLDEKSALIAFGDSSGKGAAAALYGAMVTGLLKSFGTRRTSPARLMRQLNDRLIERRVDGQYVTLLLAKWDAEERSMTFASAGGGLPLLLRDGEVTRLNLEGVPLGLLEGREYEEVVYQVQPGDIIGLFSDGFEDQGGATEGTHFGESELSKAFRQHRRSTPQHMVEKLLADVEAYRGKLPQHDDQSSLIIKIQ